MKQTLLITGKPSKALDSKTKNLLTVAQNSVKWRFKQYLQGRQQGLEMIWRNIMIDLRENHKKSQKIV
ncbi:hypothetical protein [Escherichia phage EC104]|uniref:Uncharacterized protein n=1 Tax=Salmonella phage MET_P1_179_112 TaxID=3032423 RepID=A0AAF0FPS4_9CAUD|nr:hypothetical protein [Salmonella enterica subsp. enterica]UIS74068.1 hypothetical protein [Escherichia phage EC100]URF91590.1 hypothetical protein [Escherichia phage EC122]URN70616.1 hypothetical protein [Escherichia phage EC104]URN70771.1 hypothetical protein [Escherichia phage EC105]URN70937.1 hypothetical protein [Escherichia phage EC142]WFG41511.1 hypothetical protein PPPIIDFJ_00173 [Salmonella phage MET_P1_179_112]